MFNDRCDSCKLCSFCYIEKVSLGIHLSNNCVQDVFKVTVFCSLLFVFCSAHNMWVCASLESLFCILELDGCVVQYSVLIFWVVRNLNFVLCIYISSRYVQDVFNVTLFFPVFLCFVLHIWYVASLASLFCIFYLDLCVVNYSILMFRLVRNVEFCFIYKCPRCPPC